MTPTTAPKAILPLLEAQAPHPTDHRLEQLLALYREIARLRLDKHLAWLATPAEYQQRDAPTPS